MDLRVRALGIIGTYGFVLAVVLVVLGLAALGVAAQTYTNPPVETVSEETNTQTVAASIQTSAIVENETPLYEEGAELRNMPVYFTNATPNLTYHVHIETPDDVPVDVDHRLVIHMRASRDDQVFWESRRLLAADTTTVEDGTHWTNTTANMTEIRSVLAEKQAAVGTVGTFEVELRYNATYQTPDYSGNLAATTGIVTTTRAYWLQENPGDSATHSETLTRELQQPPDLERVATLAVLGLLAILGGIVVLRTYQGLDHEQLATERARSRYEEWISNGEIPTKSEKEYVRVDTLEDLVDVAIDSNKRVIYDSDLDAYAVLEENLVYFYTTGEEDLSSWIDI